LASSGEIDDPCGVPTFRRLPFPVLHHSRLQPFTDQAQDARVGDTLFHMAASRKRNVARKPAEAT
jgi:hypothetical protein